MCKPRTCPIRTQKDAFWTQKDAFWTPKSALRTRVRRTNRQVFQKKAQHYRTRRIWFREVFSEKAFKKGPLETPGRFHIPMIPIVLYRISPTSLRVGWKKPVENLVHQTTCQPISTSCGIFPSLPAAFLRCSVVHLWVPCRSKSLAFALRIRPTALKFGVRSKAPFHCWIGASITRFLPSDPFGCFKRPCQGLSASVWMIKRPLRRGWYWFYLLG